MNPPRRRSPWFDEESDEAICAKNEESRKKLLRETRAANDHYSEMRREIGRKNERFIKN